MKHKTDSRSLFTYTCILLVGLFLLALVSPSLGAALPLEWLTVLFSILPLIALTFFAVYLFGKSSKTTLPIKRNTSRNLASTASLGILLSVVLTFLSTKQSAYTATTLRYVFENIGVGFLFLAFVATVLLINNQKFIYWPFWNASDKANADERQRTVRERVFEKAYCLNIIVLIVAAVLSQTPSQRLKDELFQVAVLCLLGLPAIIAGWRKDS